MPELRLLLLVVMIITNAVIAVINRNNMPTLLCAVVNLVVCILMVFGIL